MKKHMIMALITGLLAGNAVAEDAARIDTQPNTKAADKTPDTAIPARVNEMITSFFDAAPAVDDPFGRGNKAFIPFKTMDYPRMDMVENKDSLEISLEVPGIDKKDIDLQVVSGMVSISYEDKGAISKKKDGTYVVSERNKQSFHRAFSIPNYADADKATAEYKDGILYIHIPKVEGSKAVQHKIDIK